MKTELFLVGGTSTGGIDLLPIDVLLPCRTYQDVMKVSMRMSRIRRSQEDWAELLGYSSGKFSRILNCNLNSPGKDKAFFNPAKYRLFCQLTGNYGLPQWFDLEAKGLLNHQRQGAVDEEIEGLEQRLAELKARRDRDPYELEFREAS